MGKGGYLGGSTVFRAFPKVSGRKGPRKGALDTWLYEAKEAGISIPDGIELNPIAGIQPTEKRENKRRKPKGKKKKLARKGKTTREVKAANTSAQKNEPLPEYADLVNALREKYSK